MNYIKIVYYNLSYVIIIKIVFFDVFLYAFN